MDVSLAVGRNGDGCASRDAAVLDQCAGVVVDLVVGERKAQAHGGRGLLRHGDRQRHCTGGGIDGGVVVCVDTQTAAGRDGAAIAHPRLRVVADLVDRQRARAAASHCRAAAGAANAAGRADRQGKDVARHVGIHRHRTASVDGGVLDIGFEPVAVAVAADAVDRERGTDGAGAGIALPAQADRDRNAAGGALDDRLVGGDDTHVARAQRHRAALDAGDGVEVDQVHRTRSRTRAGHALAGPALRHRNRASHRVGLDALAGNGRDRQVAVGSRRPGQGGAVDGGPRAAANLVDRDRDTRRDGGRIALLARCERHRQPASDGEDAGLVTGRHVGIAAGQRDPRVARRGFGRTGDAVHRNRAGHGHSRRVACAAAAGAVARGLAAGAARGGRDHRATRQRSDLQRRVGIGRVAGRCGDCIGCQNEVGVLRECAGGRIEAVVAEGAGQGGGRAATVAGDNRQAAGGRDHGHYILGRQRQRAGLDLARPSHGRLRVVSDDVDTSGGGDADAGLILLLRSATGATSDGSSATPRRRRAVKRQGRPAQGPATGPATARCVGVGFLHGLADLGSRKAEAPGLPSHDGACIHRFGHVDEAGIQDRCAAVCRRVGVADDGPGVAGNAVDRYRNADARRIAGGHGAGNTGLGLERRRVDVGIAARDVGRRAKLGQRVAHLFGIRHRAGHRQLAGVGAGLRQREVEHRLVGLHVEATAVATVDVCAVLND